MLGKRFEEEVKARVINIASCGQTTKRSQNKGDFECLNYSASGPLCELILFISAIILWTSIHWDLFLVFLGKFLLVFQAGLQVDKSNNDFWAG